MIRHLLAALTLGLPLPVTGAAAQASPPVTVFVVRHAEKGPENPDPPLSAAGHKRAEALARVLADARISAAFASEFKRTRETVAPLAAAGGFTTQVIPAAALDSLVGRVRALPPGSRAVVASHSNLVHLIVEKLSGVKLTPLTEADYDRLFVVVVWPEGRGEAYVLKYDER
ncbi:MAG TPA: phosphoglycerate mutase family protein [Gemmatimonadales bacterium]|nr:phosphoglycerate mutase family protein [Gemmatimonadales bacterium]